METIARGQPHLMRVMLISNIAVDERFANGTQGRLLHWHPGATESKRRALPAYCSDLLARFCKESSLKKLEMIPRRPPGDIEHPRRTDHAATMCSAGVCFDSTVAFMVIPSPFPHHIEPNKNHLGTQDTGALDQAPGAGQP